MINSELETNLTMPTFGVSPTNFKEFIVALHGLRH